MWDNLTRRHSPRAKALLGSSYICLIYGIAYTPLSDGPVRLPAGLDVVSAAVALWVFGAMWLAVGVAGFAVFFLHRRGAAVFAAQFGLFLLWTLSYALAWILGDPRGWVAASISGGIAVMIMYLTRVEPPMWWPIRLRRPKWSK